jgi:predicted dithiol-disulfide oxidoreductase (DUF899 family)
MDRRQLINRAVWQISERSSETPGASAGEPAMPPSHKVVSHAEWIEARQELLRKEKEFTRLRAQMSEQQRALPWDAVDKSYAFDGPDGRETLSDLFAGRSQLIVYHFMFGPDWSAGCPHCSFWADNFDGAVVHLAQRDVTMVAVSRAPWATLAAYRERMGWRFKWVSSGGTDFNFDFQDLVRARGRRQPGHHLQLRPPGAGQIGPRGPQRLLQGRRAHLPHLFDLCARHRRGERGLPAARSGAEGPRRGRASAILGAPPRRVRRRRRGLTRKG